MNTTMVPNFKRSKALRKIVRNLVVVTYLFFIAHTPIHAQSATLSITPPVVEILLAPGKKIIQNFTFKAEGSDLAVIPEIHLAKPQDDHGHVTIDPNHYNPSAIPLTISSNHELDKAIPLKNGELNLIITFEAASVDIAEDIYLALVMKVVTTDALQSSSSTLPGISSLILASINPSGITPIDLDISNFDLPLFHDSYLPLTVSPTLRNNVGVMLRPQGSFEVLSYSGKTIYSLPLYPNLILGDSARSIQSNIKDLPSTITWSPSWGNMGPYRLRLTITTEGGTKIVEVEKPVWVFPIRGIILITLAAIIATIIFIQNKRKKIQKSLDR